MQREMALALLALVALAAAARGQCPAGCACSTSLELEFYCPPPPRSAVELTAKRDTYVNVHCESENVTCADFPNVSLSSSGTLDQVSVTSCPARLLPCLLTALHVRDVRHLMLTELPESPTPEDLNGLNLTHLYLRNGNIRSVPRWAQLHILRNLRIRHGNMSLEPDAFTGADHLEFLELSSSNITRIPVGAFRGLSHLHSLQLWDNAIHTIYEGSFEGLDSLVQLSLSKNSLSAVPPLALSGARQLAALDLSDNPLLSLAPLALSGPPLQNITIKENRGSLSLHNGTFSNLPSLQNLILTYCGIRHLPDDLFSGSPKIGWLSLAHNQLSELPELVFADQASLKELDLSYNKLVVLPDVFHPLKSLEELNLNRNYIEVLPSDPFSGMTRLRTLKMDDNFLHQISQDAFLSATSLQTVSLQRNRLSLEPPADQLAYGNMVINSPFRSLRKLRRLMLRGNRLQKIYDDWMLLMPKLELLDLAQNDFDEITSYDMQFIFNTTIDLTDNNISHILMPFVPSRQVEEARVSTILLDGNPIACDCLLFPFFRMLKRDGPVLPVHIRLGNARCASPPEEEGRLVTELEAAQLTCEVPETECPSACSSCVLRPATLAAELNCKRLPDTLPDFSEQGYGGIELRLGSVAGLDRLPDTVRTLNLSGLGLERVSVPTGHLEELDLSRNSLTQIPMDFLRSNLSLYLSNNPIECDCWNRDDILELRDSSRVKDLSGMFCSDGQRIADLDTGALCAVWNASVAGGGTALVFFVVFITICVLLWRYSYEIRVYLVSRGYLKWLITAELLDEDKEYDAFISFSHRDSRFVEDELMPKLEREFNLKVCVHYRDWIVGDMIPDQIAKSVEKSRKTVLVLSRAFLSSTWAQLEFRAAHMSALRDGRPRVVIVLLHDDVIHDDNVTEELRAYLSTNTYLKCSDGRFWERLRRALEPRMLRYRLLRKMAADRGRHKAKGGALDTQLNSEGQIVNAAFNMEAV